MKYLQSILQLFTAVFKNIRYIFSTVPGTPLRVLGMIWIEFTALEFGKKFTSQTRAQIACLLYYHATLNKYLDFKDRSFKLQSQSLRTVQKSGLSHNLLKAYRKELTSIIKFSQRAQTVREIRTNRERELELLVIMLYKLTEIPLELYEKKSLIGTMMLIQLLDDTLDYQCDLNGEIKTYLTCYALTRQKSKSVMHKRLFILRYYNNLKKHPRLLKRIIMVISGCIVLELVSIVNYINKQYNITLRIDRPFKCPGL